MELCFEWVVSWLKSQFLCPKIHAVGNTLKNLVHLKEKDFRLKLN